jgi:STE24 endopeptidase
MFNKFTPLEDGDLKESIKKMMSEVGLSSDGIFVMDASKRDTRLNAYFGGLGKSKRVVLFDTLLEKLTNQELLAVLGHELGHYSHKDIWKNIGMMGGFLFVAFYIFGHLPESLFTEIGIVPTGGAVLAIIILLLPVLSFIYTPIMSIISRHNEYEADKFGSKIGGKNNLVSALLKLVKENKSFPKSDPIYSKFYYSHPPIIERLKALGFDVDKPLPKDGIFQFMDESK